MISVAHIGSQAVKHRLARAASALACAMALAGCSANGGCDVGQTTVDSTVREFLTAAQLGDRAGVEAEIFPSLEFGDSDIEQLRQSLQGVDVNAVVISSSSETPNYYQVLVTGQNGTPVGRYEVSDQKPGCFAVAWGHPRPPGPSEHVTPSSASTQKP